MAPPRPAWWPLRVVDGVSWVLILPFSISISLAASCYTLTTHDNASNAMLFARFAVMGPVLFIFSFIAFLPAIIGWLLEAALYTYAAHLIQPFTYRAPTHPDTHPASLPVRHVKSQPKSKPDDQEDGPAPTTQPNGQPDNQPDSQRSRDHPFRVTVSSANVILAPEVIARFNNCPNTSWRLKEISSRMLRQNKELNQHPNLHPPVQRERVVVSQFPEVDIFLLQEVVERRVGRALVAALQDTYPYCVYDVGTHSKTTNLFLLSSGLFLASKFPVLDCDFHPYSSKSHYGNVMCLGVLLAKVDLGVVVRAGREVRRVGYVANTHTQAYQGKKTIVSSQLTEASTVYAQYIDDTHDTQTEELMFAVLGGDFNVDNMSEADHNTQQLPLWDEYIDPCRVRAGQDQPWAIGTEHRQKQLGHPALKHPNTFRTVLLDDVLRRHFILDADVKVHTLDLMSVRPLPGSDGKVGATPEGGRRRIDCLLSKKCGKMHPASFWFVSATAGLSDHLPVAMMLQEEDTEDRKKREAEETEERGKDEVEEREAEETEERGKDEAEEDNRESKKDV